MKHAKVYVAAMVLLLFAQGCKKSDSGTAPPEATPAAAPVSTAPAPAPLPPPPSFSAAQKLGMFAYAKNGQSSDQQLRDEFDCYGQVQQQTGINPDTSAPAGASAAEIQAAQQEAAANAPQAQGGRAKGAAKGALGGAAIGGITGNAGRGAAIGATVGTVRGGRKQKAANEASQQQAAQTAGSQVQQQANQAKADYNKQISTFKRAFSACMDARGYSVK